MNDKVKSVLDGVIDQFNTGDIPEAVSHKHVSFP